MCHQSWCCKCGWFLILQSGRHTFALAAEHGCVQMLEILMEPFKMASMKPDKVCVDCVRFCCSSLQKTGFLCSHVPECTFLCHTCKIAQTLFDASCFPASLLPERGHASALSCQERPLGRCPTAAAKL